MTPSRQPTASFHALTAVIFLPWTAGASAADTLGTLLSSTDPAVPILLPATGADLRGTGSDRLHVLSSRDGNTPGALLNVATEYAPLADLVVIADAVNLIGDWLPRLQAAAAAADGPAAVTTLVTGPGEPVLGEPPLGPSSANVGLGAARNPSRPTVLAPWPHCTLIRREGLQLTGPFNRAFTHPAAVLADFGVRALAHGLTCVVADDICLSRAQDRLGPVPKSDRELLRSEHPWLATAATDQAEARPGPLRRALAAARTTRVPISVTVDARALGLGVGGTQTYVAELVLALARSGAVTVRAVVGGHAAAETTDAFDAAGVELVAPEMVEEGLAPTDVVHRPQQVFSTADLRLLQKMGDRLVISQMDLILYRNPAYHGSVQSWLDYRRATRLALAIADETIFFSEHGRGEAMAEDLVDPARTSIVGIGVELGRPIGPESRPAGISAGAEFLLVLGSDYTHKNRPFAIGLADELGREQGWEGYLVLAGAHQAHGSSQAEERRLLSERPGLASRVIDLGAVPEAERRWLTSAASAHICASSQEGFGLIPLEAAAAGRPCIYAPRTSLAEIIDPRAATIVPWDVGASAARAAPLLRAGAGRDRHLALLGDALRKYTWHDVVLQLVEVYQRAIGSPYRGATPLTWEAIRHEEQRRDLQDRVRYGQILIDSRGGLLTPAQQRGLMRVASRRWLRGPLLAPFGLLGLDEREAK